MNNILYNLFQHKLSKYVKKTEIDGVISEKIVDDLVSDDSDKALSAKQGKKLKASIDAVVASGGGDMLSVDYDEDRDGIIDRAKADEYGNDIAGTYATKSEVEEQAQSISETYATKAEFEEHTHSADAITSGTFVTDRLPITPVSKGGTGASTPETARENLGAAYTFITKVQALNTGWVLEDTMYAQSIECTDLLSTDAPVLDIVTGDSLDDNKLFIEAWTHVVRAVANDGNIVLYADSTPNVSFSFYVKVVR